MDSKHVTPLIYIIPRFNSRNTIIARFNITIEMNTTKKWANIESSMTVVRSKVLEI